MVFKSLALLATIGLLSLFLAQTKVSLAQEGDGIISASFLIIDPIATIDTAITPTPSELSALEAALEPITGTDLTQTGESIEIVASEQPGAELSIALPIVGAPEGLLSGDINFTLGNLDTVTDGGQTAVTIQFGSFLTMDSTARLSGTDEGGIELNLIEPKLVFEPPDPDVNQLPGGDADVTQIGAKFSVDLRNLPDGAGLDITFAKDASALLENAGSKFVLLADSVDAEIGALSNDVAFGISVFKPGITNADLGDNQVTLKVSKAWFDAKIAEEKRILIVKFDAGDPLPPPKDVTDSCTSFTDPVVCSAIFSGSQGGLSVFFLVAMTLENAVPVASAAFLPVVVEPAQGTFQVVATGIDSDGDTLTVVALIVTPPTLGLVWELVTAAQVKLSFEIATGKLEIRSPDPEQTLESLQQLNGFLVQDGQTAEIEIIGGEDIVIEVDAFGTLMIEASQVTLQVTATDPLGQSGTASASPVFPPTELVVPSQQVPEDSSATSDDEEQPPPDVNTQSVLSQVRARVVPDREIRIHTPDGQVEIIIPANFLLSGDRGKSIEIELKNLDPTQVPTDSDGLTPIRAIEVNVLVDGKEGSIDVNGAATLVIPLSPLDTTMASDDLSTLTIHRLNPATGAWEPLTTVIQTGSTPPRLEASLREFQQAAFGIFRSAAPENEADRPDTSLLPEGNEPDGNEESPIPAKEEAGGWSARAFIGLSLAAAATLAAIAISALVFKRNRVKRSDL